MPNNNRQSTCYLAGPMEDSADEGLGWRLRYQKILKNYNVECILPNLEEAHISQGDHFSNYKNEKDLARHNEFLHAYTRLDLAFVEEVDFIIVRWAGEKTAGTIGEAQHAFLNHKRIYLITDQDIKDIPSWFLSHCTWHTNKIFRCLEDVITYMKEHREI